MRISRSPILISLLLIPVVLFAQDFVPRSAPLPDETIRSLLEEISGENAVQYASVIGSYSRYPGSGGFHQALEYVVAQAKAAGLEDVQVHRFPGLAVGWDPVEGSLDIVSPAPQKLIDLRDVPVMVAQNSHDTDLTAEIVDVGTGRRAEEYEGKDIAGKIVLASTHPIGVQPEAIFKRHAAGIITYHRSNFYGLQTPEKAVAATSLKWTGPNGEAGGFAISISHWMGEQLHARLAAKEKIVVHVHIKTAVTQPGYYEMVSARFPGTETNDQDIIFSAHLDHMKPGANDNASGSAVLLEMARTLTALRAAHKLPPLRRNLIFWWVTELETTQRYFFEFPKQADDTLVGINIDQAGGDRLGRNDFVLQAALRITPSFLNALMMNFGEYASRNLAAVNRAPSPLFIAPSGTRQPFLMRAWREEDEKPTTDSFAYIGLGIPGVNIAVPSFDVIHSSADSVNRLDPTQMKRSAYLALAPAIYLSALKPAQVPGLADIVLADALTQIGDSAERALSSLAAASGENLRQRYAAARDRINDAVTYQEECMRSMTALADSQARPLRYIEKQVGTLEQLRTGYEGVLRDRLALQADALGVTRNSEPGSPPDLAWAAQTVLVMNSPLGQHDKRIWDYGAKTYPEWYAKHMIDNHRTVLEIYTAIHGLYPDYTMAELRAYYEQMEKAQLVHTQERAK